MSSSNDFSSEATSAVVHQSQHNVPDDDIARSIRQWIQLRLFQRKSLQYSSQSSNAADDPETATICAWEVPAEVVNEVQRIVPVLEYARPGSVKYCTVVTMGSDTILMSTCIWSAASRNDIIQSRRSLATQVRSMGCVLGRHC